MAGDVEFLRRELPRWVEEGLITAEQGETIRARYADGAGPAAPSTSRSKDSEAAPAAEGQARKPVISWMPVILIVLAVVLVGAGMILFYAANWRKMSPPVKLVQIFGVLVGSYGASYYFLFTKRRIEIAGRGLMMLGMLSFGAAIGLIAQIFHISAHPANGVLAWAVAVLALSLVMEERFGYYLAAVLFLVWNCWEVGVYGNPNYPFVVVPPILLVAFHRKADHAGMIVAAFELLFFFYQVNVHHLAVADYPAFVMLHLPLGVVLVAQDRLVRARSLRTVAGVLGGLGWLFIFAPLIGLSWPTDLPGDWLFFEAGRLPLALEHAALLCAGAVLVHLLRRRGEPVWLHVLCLALGLVLLLLPVGKMTVLVVVTHLGLLAVVLGLLHHSHALASGRAVDRVFAYLLFFATLGVKGVGLFSMAMLHRQFYVAYSIGFVILATVLFLMALYVDELLAEKGSKRLSLPALCGVPGAAIFLMVYAVSFRVPEQAPVLQADSVVIVLLALFLLLALAFYALLWRRGAHRLLLALSGVVFFASVAILLIAGPSVPWPVYSVAFNLLLLVTEGVLLYYSTRVNSVLLVNLAIAGFGLQVTTRYFDVFWDLLSGSLLFIITGAVLFGGGVLLEVNRRKVIRMIQDERGTEHEEQEAPE